MPKAGVVAEAGGAAITTGVVIIATMATTATRVAVIVLTVPTDCMAPTDIRVTMALRHRLPLVRCHRSKDRLYSHLALRQRRGRQCPEAQVAACRATAALIEGRHPQR